VLRSRAMFGSALFVLFVLLRSLFLGTLENPEPRYTLECYPVVIVMAAVFLSGKSHRNDRKPAQTGFQIRDAECEKTDR